VIIYACMDNSLLCQLIRDALCNEQRAEALALAIDQIPEIKVYLGTGWLPYYDKALPTTIRDICKNIQRFPTMYKLDIQNLDCQNPQDAATIRKYFIKWVLIILRRDCYDVKRSQSNRPRQVSINEPIKSENGQRTVEDTIADPGITGILKLENEELKDIAQQIENYINTDPDNKLKNCHPRNNRDLNCQVLLRLKLLEQKTTKEITQELNAREQTVYDRLRNSCLPLIKQITQEELGYK
jgi:DNA-directed RNA polymerase specialized sigma24 family protein